MSSYPEYAPPDTQSQQERQRRTRLGNRHYAAGFWVTLLTTTGIVLASSGRADLIVGAMLLVGTALLWYAYQWQRYEQHQGVGRWQLSDTHLRTWACIRGAFTGYGCVLVGVAGFSMLYG